MKTIQQTICCQEIISVLSLENMYNDIVYDGSPDLNMFDPDIAGNVWFILKEDDNIAGIVKLELLNNILWMPHIIIRTLYRKNNSEEWGKQIAQYMRDRYGAKKFIAMTPYEPAKKYAEKIGFVYLTTLKKSIKKNDQLLDQYVLELGEETL